MHICIGANHASDIAVNRDLNGESLIEVRLIDNVSGKPQLP